MDLLYTPRKFGKPLPADLAKATGNDGSVTATPEYLCPVDIGEQTLNLDFDTGSTDLWVPLLKSQSTYNFIFSWVFLSQLSSASKEGHTVYDPSKSSAYKAKSGYTWDITCGDGSGTFGTVSTDTVTVGGTKVTGQAVEIATKVTGQAVEIATKVSSAFVFDTANDGLLGLAFSSINTGKFLSSPQNTNMN